MNDLATVHTRFHFISLIKKYIYDNKFTVVYYIHDMDNALSLIISDRLTYGHGCGQWMNDTPINVEYGDGWVLPAVLSCQTTLNFPIFLCGGRKRV